MSSINVNLESALDAFKIESESILATGENIDREEFSRAVVALASASRICASGCGHSGIACRHFAHLMCCIDLPARFLSPAEAVHGGLGFVHEDDVLVIVSRGGKTDELMPIVEVAKTKGAKIICVTEKLETTSLPMGYQKHHLDAVHLFCKECFIQNFLSLGNCKLTNHSVSSVFNVNSKSKANCKSS